MALLEKNSILDVLKVTEFSALSCWPFIGRGQEKEADEVAVNAMRKALNALNLYGVVVIGEGERDKAPMLYIGEEVGSFRGDKTRKDIEQVDIALDPLEGTTICAKAGAGSLSVLAMAKRGHFLHAPDVYMDKMACGPRAHGSISFDVSVEENIERVGQALQKSPSDMNVVVLDRPRHQDLIQQVRKANARIQLIGDGDVSAALLTCFPSSGVDLLLGTGGAPEGVLAASALKSLGGDFLGRLCFRNEEEEKRAHKMGIQDLNKVYTREELVKGESLFFATGVTDGPLLKGIKKWGEKTFQTHSLLISSQTPSTRTIKTKHFVKDLPSLYGGK